MDRENPGTVSHRPAGIVKIIQFIIISRLLKKDIDKGQLKEENSIG